RGERAVERASQLRAFNPEYFDTRHHPIERFLDRDHARILPSRDVGPGTGRGRSPQSGPLLQGGEDIAPTSTRGGGGPCVERPTDRAPAKHPALSAAGSEQGGMVTREKPVPAQ